MMYLRAISPILHLKVFSIYCVYVSFWIQYSDWSVIDTCMYVCLKFFSTYCVYVSFWIQYYDLSRFKTQLYIPLHFYHYFQTQFSSIFFYLYLTLSDIIYFFCIFYVDEMFLTQYQNFVHLIIIFMSHISLFRFQVKNKYRL